MQKAPKAQTTQLTLHIPKISLQFLDMSRNFALIQISIAPPEQPQRARVDLGLGLSYRPRLPRRQAELDNSYHRGVRILPVLDGRAGGAGLESGGKRDARIAQHEARARRLHCRRAPRRRCPCSHQGGLAVGAQGVDADAVARRLSFFFAVGMDHHARARAATPRITPRRGGSSTSAERRPAREPNRSRRRRDSHADTLYHSNTPAHDPRPQVEIAKLRAARRLWAELVKARYPDAVPSDRGRRRRLPTCRRRLPAFFFHTAPHPRHDAGGSRSGRTRSRNQDRRREGAGACWRAR